MKRMICVFLALVTVFCFALSVSARDVQTDQYKYVKQYYLQYCGEVDDPDHWNPKVLDIGDGFYEELFEYYANPDDETPSWALVRACRFAEPAYPSVYRFFCPDRYLITESNNDPFKSQYGIYDLDNDQWMDLTDALKSEEYPELTDVCNELKIGRIYGDMDKDFSITILDATKIQRFLVGLEKYEWGQDLTADYDRDGEATVLDATAIQRHLAGLDRESAGT